MQARLTSGSGTSSSSSAGNCSATHQQGPGRASGEQSRQSFGSPHNGHRAGLIEDNVFMAGRCERDKMNGRLAASRH